MSHANQPATKGALELEESYHNFRLKSHKDKKAITTFIKDQRNVLLW